MENTAAKQDSGLLYQVDETPPVGLTLGLGLQMALLCVCTIVINPTIVYRTAGQPAENITWAVFVSLLIAGTVTVLHANPTRRIGAGYLLIASTAAGTIAVSVDALTAGGQGLLLTLMIASALFQMVFSWRIAAFRRILTPTVTGTMLMLIPVTIAPINFQRLTEVPEGHLAWSGGACALATIAMSVLIAFKGGPRLRPWGPFIGIVAGAALAGALGLYDIEGVLEADWIGVPTMAWPTPKPDFGPAFWGLLPAFLMVSMAYTVRTTSVTAAIQDVSWRTRRAPDLGVAQRTIAADAGANALAGLAGGTFFATGTSTIALTQATGVASRRLGVVMAGSFAAFAFMPKIIALVVAFAKAKGWTNQMAERLEAVVEETLLTLTENEEDKTLGQRRLQMLGRKEGRGAVLEFIARADDANIEDRIAMLEAPGNEYPNEREVSLKLLRHLATEIRHRQYHDMDFVTVRIENTEVEKHIESG